MVGVINNKLDALSPAHFQYCQLIAKDKEFEELMRLRVIAQDYPGIATEIKNRIQRLHEKLHLLFTKYILQLRTKWTEHAVSAVLQSGVVVYLLDSPKNYLTMHELAIVHTIFMGKDSVDRHALVQIDLTQPGGNPRYPKHRKAFLSWAISSLSAPVVKNEDRSRLKSSFYDITNFFVNFGEFLGSMEDEQNTGFNPEDVYKYHANSLIQQPVLSNPQKKTGSLLILP